MAQMIHINRKFEPLASHHRVKILTEYDIISKLDAKINSTNNTVKSFYEYLKKNIVEILEKDITYIAGTIIPAIEGILGDTFFTAKNPANNKEKKEQNEIDELGKIFNYTSFSTVKKIKYCAYDLVESIGIRVCPYCNRQYINTLKPSNTKGGTRATLDHFYLKSEFPYLALSFWNLVPSCYSCNSQLRGPRDIELHPYQKGFEEILHFYTDISELSDFIGDSQRKFNFRLEEFRKMKPSTTDLEKANKNKSVFRLNDIYQNHSDHVREMIQKAIVYSTDYSETLYEKYKDLFIDKNDARTMMLSNYVEVKDFEKRPLAKLTRDIAEDIGLL